MMPSKSSSKTNIPSYPLRLWNNTSTDHSSPFSFTATSFKKSKKKSSSEKSSTQNPCVFLSLSVLQHKRIGRFNNLQHDVLLVFFLFCRLNLTLMLTYGSVVSRTLENNHAMIIQRQHLNLVLGTHCLLKLFQFPYTKGTFFHTCQSMESRYVIWLVYLRHVVLNNAIWLVRIQSAT